jgi:hypothetical protein
MCDGNGRRRPKHPMKLRVQGLSQGNADDAQGGKLLVFSCCHDRDDKPFW